MTAPLSEQVTVPPRSICTTPCIFSTFTRQVTVPVKLMVVEPTNSVVCPSPHCTRPSLPGTEKRTV